ncbi:NADH-quinone oxidoreductase subunit C [Imperialibacter roseus]|uniref:NADH-quinone oxidoreductase subunit C n=1 Tax=Imperialibacter roseus TaxID=1324217 RepID=A0ABZ0IXW3_9BACT|nr:NADH-quinone oxidoreductase subunit C [Imperialibacter roseus]WOK08969.1 NADH-quinone oxidoreductase subunit C [Imperialibacter roseus]|tara:strand:- start:66055 stop:66510 length:456 start_codon:yes stop_codon:yes gene_type:complete
MTREAITEFATALVPDLIAGPSKQFPEFVVPAEKMHAFAAALKNEPILKMDYLFCLTAADRKDGLHVIYHLTSTEFRHSVLVKVVLPDKENPEVATVSDLWKAAEYYEREVFDLFGIKFTDHPDMRRIFLEDDWVGFPLRKDYKDEFTLEH